MKFTRALLSVAAVAGMATVQAVNLDMTLYTNYVGTGSDGKYSIYSDAEKHLFAASYLSAYHFNQKDGSIVPKYADACNVKLRVTSLETYGSVSKTIDQYSTQKASL